MQRIAFFDFDGTLLPQRNSLAWHFVKGLPSAQLRAERAASFIRAMGGLIPRAALGLIEHDPMYLAMIRAIFRGLPVAAARASAKRVADHIEQSLFVPVRDALEAHAGDQTFLVSANMAPLVEVFCERRGIGCIATRLEISGDVYTGELLGVLCKKEEKVRRIAEYITDDHEVHAYGNSLEDLPMLRLAHRPVLVNPDSQLSRVSELAFAPRIFVDGHPSAFGA